MTRTTFKTFGVLLATSFAGVFFAACSTDESMPKGKTASASSSAASSKSSKAPEAPLQGDRGNSADDDHQVVRKSPPKSAQAQSAGKPASQLGLAQCADKDYSGAQGSDGQQGCQESK